MWLCARCLHICRTYIKCSQAHILSARGRHKSTFKHRRPLSCICKTHISTFWMHLQMSLQAQKGITSMFIVQCTCAKTFVHIYLSPSPTSSLFLGPRGPLRTPLVSVVPLSATKIHATSHYSFSDSKLILFLFQTLSSHNLSHSTQYTEHWTGSSRGPF